MRSTSSTGSTQTRAPPCATKQQNLCRVFGSPPHKKSQVVTMRLMCSISDNSLKVFNHSNGYSVNLSCNTFSILCSSAQRTCEIPVWWRHSLSVMHSVEHWCGMMVEGKNFGSYSEAVCVYSEVERCVWKEVRLIPGNNVRRGATSRLR